MKIKKISFYSAILCAMLAGLPSCTEDEVVNIQQDVQLGKEPELHLNFKAFDTDGQKSRVAMDQLGKMNWAVGDKINVAYIKKINTADSAVKDGEFFVAATHVYEYTAENKFVQQLAEGSKLTLPGTEDMYYAVIVTADNSRGIRYHRTADGVVDKIMTPYTISEDATQNTSAPMNFAGKAHMAGCTEVRGNEENVYVSLKHLCTLMEYRIKNSTGKPFALKGFSYMGTSAEGEGTAVAPKVTGLFTANLLDPNLELLVDDEKPAPNKSVNVTFVGEGEGVTIPAGETYSIYSLIAPFQFKQNDLMPVKVTTDKGCFEKNYTIKSDLNFKRGCWNKATVEVTNLIVNITNPTLAKDLLQYDSNKDGLLTSEEIEAITTFNVKESYTSFEGLELLTNLLKIDFIVPQPELQSLDLSKNKKLQIAWLYNDTPKLNKIDVSGCPKLTHFVVKNPIEQNYDLSNKEKLTYVFISNNAKSLNVTGCSALTKIEVYGVLKSLVVEGCPLLKTLTISEPDFPSLDLTKCKGLESVVIGGNYGASIGLQSLDVSGLTKLTKLDITTDKSYRDKNKFSKLIMTGCDALEYVRCNNCHVKELDFSGKIKLHTVICDNISSKRIDSEKITLNFTGCSALTRLDCRNNYFLNELDIRDCNHALGTTAENYLKVKMDRLSAIPPTIYVWKGFHSQSHDGCDWYSEKKNIFLEVK